MSDHHTTEEHDHEDEHELEHLRSHIGFYWGIFWALIVGTILTIGAAFIDIGHVGNITLGLFIATVKATLVLLFFMHLSNEKKTIYRFMLFTVFFAFGMMTLCLLALFDHPHLIMD